MPIKFSDHAIEQLKERRISKSKVKETVENPDEILPSYRDRKLRRKIIDGKILEIVTKTEGSKITVIKGYYLKEKHEN